MAKATYDPNLIMSNKPAKRPLKPGDPGFVMEVDRVAPSQWGNPDPAAVARGQAERTQRQWGNPNPALMRKPGGDGGIIGNVAAAIGGAVAGNPPPARSNAMFDAMDAAGRQQRLQREQNPMQAGNAAVNSGAPMPYDKRMQVDIPGAVGGAISGVVNHVGRAVAPGLVGAVGNYMLTKPLVNTNTDRPENGVYYDERAPKTVEPGIPVRGAGQMGNVRVVDRNVVPLQGFGQMGAVRVSDRNISDPYPPTPEDYRPIQMAANRPQPGMGVGMGDVRMAERNQPAPQQQAQPRMESDLPPLPFNDRKARQRAQADYQRVLHTDSQGLSYGDRESRIAAIRNAEDQRDAYARANRPLQKVQTPGEIADRHSELGRQGADYAKNEVLDAQAKMAAITEQIKSGAAPQDFASQMAFQQSRLERGQQILDKFTRDPYWQQTSPEKAGQIQAGQERLRERQMGDRTSGAADVAAYQGRQQYDRNLEDTVRQRQIAEKMAESRAREAQSQAIIDNKGQTPQDRIAGAQADAEVAKANAITRVLGSPDAAKRFEDNFKRENGLTGSSPEQIQLAGNMLDTTLQKMGDLAGETWFTNNGQIDYTNRENMDASLDIADSAVSKLEAAFADYPGDVAARAAMLLASMPPWMSQGGAFPRWIEPWNKSNRDTANRLNAVGTRLKALAGIGSGQAQGQ